MCYKLYINDAEFENLNWHEQSYYLYCPKCELFYLKKDMPKGCNHINKIELSSMYGRFGGVR